MVIIFVIIQTATLLDRDDSAAFCCSAIVLSPCAAGLGGGLTSRAVSGTCANLPQWISYEVRSSFLQLISYYSLMVAGRRPG